MFTILPYSPGRLGEWNEFLTRSKNGTFLFDRSYMDYHSDRFADLSLMVLDRKGRLFALFPANRVGDTLYSHQGLTYGGMVVGPKATAADVCGAMEAINVQLRAQGIRRVVCKPLPWIYSAVPSDELLYALTQVCQARIVSRDIASVVNVDRPLPFTELRRRGVKKALAHGVRTEYSDDLCTFWHILSDNLLHKYGSRPIHSLEEITLLKSRFPGNIRLLAAFEGEEMVAGTLLYITPRVVKTQYISASPKGKETGALDALFSYLFAHTPQQQTYIDLGTSALEHSNTLRLPLIFQKEGFGARAVCYDTYEWEVGD